MIDSEVQSYCSDRRSLVSGVPERVVNGRHSHASQGHRNGKQRATSNGQSGEAAKTCSCGSPVMSARGAVTCHDIVSIFFQFFMLHCPLLTSFTALLASAISHGLRGAQPSSGELAMRGLLYEDGCERWVKCNLNDRSRLLVLCLTRMDVSGAWSATRTIEVSC
jgi:hypothetical protein